MAKVIFYSVSQTQFDSLVTNGQTKDYALYFTNDTFRIYKGTNPYGGGSSDLDVTILGSTASFPASGEINKFYIKPTKQETRIWHNNAWVNITYPVSTSLSASSTDIEIPTAKTVYDATKNSESTQNKVTSIDAQSTDTQYPSAKAMYTEIKALSDAIDGLESGSGSGEDGADGLGFEYRGAYSSSATYNKQATATPNGSVVTHEGSLWLYINDTGTGHSAPPELPTTSNTWWTLLASKGEAGTPGSGSGGGGGLSNVINKTANYTLTSSDSFATVVGNSTSAITLTLPASLSIGTWFTFVRKGTGKLSIKAPANEKIMESSLGGTLFCDTTATLAVCILEKIDNTTWIIKSGTGAWETT